MKEKESQRIIIRHLAYNKKNNRQELTNIRVGSVYRIMNQVSAITHRLKYEKEKAKFAITELNPRQAFAGKRPHLRIKISTHD